MKKTKTERNIPPPATPTDLPDRIIEEILRLLPITDAISASIVNTSWQRSWRAIPDLDLSTIKNFAFVSQTLRRHSGNLRLLKVSASDDDAAAAKDSDSHDFEFDSIIALVSGPSATSLRTLHLDNFRSDLLSIAHNFLTLIHLRAAGGSLLLLYQGSSSPFFRHLKTLVLDSIRIHGENLSQLLSACTSLESADFYKIVLEERQIIKIDDAPNLRFLRIGDFKRLNGLFIASAPLLEEALLHSRTRNDYYHGDKRTVVEILQGMPNVKMLTLWYTMFKYPFDGPVPDRIPIRLDHLTFLEVRVAFQLASEALLTLSILRCIPNLQELECESLFYLFQDTPLCDEMPGVEQDFWGKQERQVAFEKLETVHMSLIVGREPELDFIRFLLRNAQCLETMIVSFKQFDPEVSVASEILEFPRISDQVHILIEGPRVCGDCAEQYRSDVNK